MASAPGKRTNIVTAVVYFFLATVITWYFIDHGGSLYHFDRQKMVLSCSISGAKWSLQILAAILFLKDAWLFIKRIAATCLAGSLVLLPYCFDGTRALIPGNGFLVSLIASVSVMLALYYMNVQRSGISIRWYFFWLLCLAAAVSLQLTVVFHVI